MLGGDAVLTHPDEVAPYCREWRGLFEGRALAVLRPGSTAEVAQVLRLAAGTGTPVVPQGGNTGLVGGQVPDGSGSELVLSLERLARIRALDAEGATMTVEAGAVLETVQGAAEAAGLFFPLSLGSQGSARIGGLVATNAGGTGALAYGTMRDLVLGLEVVLADGRVWNGLSALKKDNTGYDLRHLFIGSEGTLGVVTAATLKLFPAPRGRAVAFAGLASPDDALLLLKLMREAVGPGLTGFELMPRLGIEFVTAHIPGTRDPLEAPHPWYALVEITAWGTGEGVLPQAEERMEAALERAFEAGLVRDAAFAATLSQAAEFWRLRHAMSEAQKPEGASLKHDVSVPVAAIPELIRRGEEAASALVPGIRPVPFGHLGDGNIHFNFSQPKDMEKAAFLARGPEVSAAVHAIVRELSGSISAEHGIGRAKRELLAEVEGEVAMDLMRRIKRAFDPQGVLSPGRVL